MRDFKSLKNTRSAGILGLCLLAFLAMPNWAVADVEPGDLVLYLPMEDAINPTDASENPTAVLVHGFLTAVPGKFGTRGLEFDGQNANRIEVSNADKLNGLSTLTVEAWVFPQNIASHEGMSIASKRIANQNADSFNLFTWTSQFVRARINAVGELVSTTALQDNTWYHIAFVFDGARTGEKSKLYINGVLEASGDHPDSAANTGAAPVWIGELDQARGFAWDGILDEVGIWNKALSEEDIHLLMAQTKGQILNGEIARNPMPAHGAEDVMVSTDLSWTPNSYAVAHHVYFGSTFDDVNDQTVPTSEAQDANTYHPGRLEFGKTYFWRVDEVNGTPDRTVFKGDVWNFSTEPYSIMIPVDPNHATASSFSGANIAAMTVNGAGLVGNTHSTKTETMWLSGPADFSPWLMYEFDRTQKLDTMLIWNSNTTSEGFIGWGIKELTIEYSIDGVDWAILAESTQFDRAPGLLTYDTPQVIQFGLVLARYVRLNIRNNWGGLLPQYGLSEVRFYGLPVYGRTPNPVSGSLDILPDVVATWRAGREAGEHTVYASPDMNAVADGLAPSMTSLTNRADLRSFDLQLGQTYYWRVDEVNEVEDMSVWAGPLWSFMTTATLVVDDFESYTNFSPDRPFQTWMDGYGYSADEYFPVVYSGNGTGAGIGHDIWSPGSPYFDGQIMETTSTLPGSAKCLPFYYSNTGGVASQTERSFAVPQDWTLGGVKTLSIPFRGQAGNTGTLYVKINNIKLTYPYAASDLAIGVWQVWNIDLSTVNTDLKNVTKLQIGVDGSGAAGMILIDDIRLHAAKGQVMTPVDPGTDGLVAKFTFEGNMNDSSGHGHDGKVVGSDGTVIVSDAERGQVLSLPGGDDQYVEVGAVGINGTMPRTIACWAKAANTTIPDWTLIFGFTGQADGTGGNGSHFNIGSLGEPGGIGAHCWGWEETMVSDQEGLNWHHYVMTYDGTTIAYFLDGMAMDSDPAKSNVQDLSASGDRVFIGSRVTQTSSFPGYVDDAVIYSRVLSAGEILSLAGKTSPVDIPF